MIFEWYTGSDKTKKRAKTFFRLYYQSRERSTTQALARQIEKLAKRERDCNMRAKFLAAGRRLQPNESDERSTTVSREEILKEFDLYAANFPHVVREYLDTCLRAVASCSHGERVQWLSSAPLAFAQVLWSDSGLDGDTADDAVCMIAEMLLALAEDFNSPILLEMAVMAALRAHHGDPEDPAPLRVLAWAYNKRGDVGSATRISDQLQQVEFRDESEEESRITASVEKFRSLLGLGDEDL